MQHYSSVFLQIPSLAPYKMDWCIVEVSAVGNLGIIMRKGSKYVEVLES